MSFNFAGRITQAAQTYTKRNKSHWPLKLWSLHSLGKVTHCEAHVGSWSPDMHQIPKTAGKLYKSWQFSFTGSSEEEIQPNYVYVCFCSLIIVSTCKKKGGGAFKVGGISVWWSSYQTERSAFRGTEAVYLWIPVYGDKLDPKAICFMFCFWAWKQNVGLNGAWSYPARHFWGFYDHIICFNMSSAKAKALSDLFIFVPQWPLIFSLFMWHFAMITRFTSLFLFSLFLFSIFTNWVVLLQSEELGPFGWLSFTCCFWIS